MNSRISLLLLLSAALFAAGCADTSAPPPAVTPPSAEMRYLVDPRIGFEGTTTPKIAQKFDAAWRFILAGDLVNARKRLTEVRTADPAYLPAMLADAAIALDERRIEDARAAVDRVRARATAGYTAVDVYAAEVALASNETRRAFDLYRDIASRPDAPEASKERFAQLSKDAFAQLFHDAQTSSGGESNRLLREALAIDPASSPARVLLVQRLVAQKNWDDARRELEPLLNGPEVERPEVQEALAEIDAGRGRYQEAIVRYERLQRRSGDTQYTRRLDEIKEQFAAANMPPQYQRAFESVSIDRADLAVLLYWKVASVRFAQNLGTPPIAIDVAEVPGREELIRAIAVGVLQVDPITRRVGPGATVGAATLSRLAARVLAVRGANCARGAGDAAKILAACGIPDPALELPPDAPVTGRAAAAVLEQVDKALAR